MASDLDDPQAILDDLRRSLGASSCTLYLPDPWEPSHLGLALMSGVKYTEPMHGFLLPRVSERKLTEPFLEDTSGVTWFTRKQVMQFLATLPSGLASNSVGGDLRFGGFPHREGVHCCARIRLLRRPSPPEAVLWVNYATSRPRYPTLAKPVVMRLTAEIRRMASLFHHSSTVDVATIIKMLRPIEALTGERTGARPCSFLSSILDAILAALNIKGGFGSVYLLNRHKMELLRLAHSGTGSAIESVQVFPTDGTPPGVISWVALKGQSILIKDIRSSEFASLYLPPQTPSPMRSLLAVPLLAREEPIGVLVLESDLATCPFEPAVVRAVWYAANHAATAFGLARQRDRTERLLRTAQTVLGQPKRTSEALNDLADLAAEEVGVDHCDVWAWNGKDFDLNYSGSTYGRLSQLPPRVPAGWTTWVARTGIPVWIWDIRGVSAFRRSFFIDGKWSQNEPARVPGLPKRINEVLKGRFASAELGVPITLPGGNQAARDCLGVMWLKFQKLSQEVPPEETVGLASGFAAQAALVMNAVRQRIMTPGEMKIAEISERRFASGGFHIALGGRVGDTGTPARCEVYGHVEYSPSGGVLGGDFYAWRRMGRARVCIIVGDVEGHASEGVGPLVLPLTTAFHMAAMNEATPRSILGRLQSVANDLAIHATAVCFMVDASNTGRPQLIVSVAGHPRLALRNSVGGVEFLPRDSVFEDEGRRDGVSPLGLGDKGLFREWTLPVGPDEFVIAYTDGITEASKKVRRMKELELIARQASIPKRPTPQRIVKSIVRGAREGTLGPLPDDVTVLAIQLARCRDGQSWKKSGLKQ